MEKAIEIFNPGPSDRINNLFNLDLNTQMKFPQLNQLVTAKPERIFLIRLAISFLFLFMYRSKCSQVFARCGILGVFTIFRT